jgi:hypothetical protein
VACLAQGLVNSGEVKEVYKHIEKLDLTKKEDERSLEVLIKLYQAKKFHNLVPPIQILVSIFGYVVFLMFSKEIYKFYQEDEQEMTETKVPR